jgi:hypothetical protein
MRRFARVEAHADRVTRILHPGKGLLSFFERRARVIQTIRVRSRARSATQETTRGERNLSDASVLTSEAEGRAPPDRTTRERRSFIQYAPRSGAPYPGRPPAAGKKQNRL